MSLIGKNIRKIRMVKKMSQNDFAQIFNVVRTSIGAYEEGRAEPKIDTVIQIAKYFGISVDALLTKEITVNELLKFNILNEDDLESIHRNQDELINETPYVSVDQQSEYVVQHSNKDFVNDLLAVQVPFTKTSKSRAFQVSSEMAFDSVGIMNQDVLICNWVNFKKVKWAKGQLYVLVHLQGIALKRYLDVKNNKLRFVSDDPHADPFSLNQDKIMEVWKPICMITDKFDQSKNVESRLDVMEDKLQRLVDKLL